MFLAARINDHPMNMEIRGSEVFLFFFFLRQVNFSSMIRFADISGQLLPNSSFKSQNLACGTFSRNFFTELNV